jgi:putative nucleotidyltransferase with HDIG domain
LKDSLELHIKEQCQRAVRDIFVRYSYQDNSELKEIRKIADDIIGEIMSEPLVIYNLSSIRHRSESIFSHSLNVSALSTILAIKLKLPKVRVKDIAIGGLLHDIGLTYIAADYNDLNLETCTDKEQKEIKMHTIYGYTAVEKMDWLSMTAKDIIVNHHERLDGSGYPFHIKRDAIKIGSKIVALCDDFDSRVYGNMTAKMKVHDVIDYIVSKAGVLFDFKVVKAFVYSVAAYPTGSIVVTNQNETGIVLRQNPQCPTRPVIRIIKDCSGNMPKTWVEKDLTKNLTLFILDTVTEES